VADTDHDQVLVYLLRGPQLLQTFGHSGSGDGEFNQVNGIAADGRFVYVADRGNSRVQLFTAPDLGDPAEFVRSATYQPDRSRRTASRPYATLDSWFATRASDPAAPLTLNAARTRPSACVNTRMVTSSVAVVSVMRIRAVHCARCRRSPAT